MRSFRRHVYASWIIGLVAAIGAGTAVATAPGASPQWIVAEHRLDALEGTSDSAQEVRFGAQLDWSTDTPQQFQARTQLRPAVYGEFVEFPFSPEVADWLSDKIEAVKAADGVFMLTLEPGINDKTGLAAVTPESLDALGAVLRKWNSAGVPVLVRYGQEMNGAWYPWGQDPTGYIRSFRLVADAVHGAPQSRMVWSPNEGGGYPFTGGEFEAKPGSEAFTKLDTDRDGRLTQRDDPYKPYWPGSRYVDWVGLSLYHFGRKYPWQANVLPEKGKFQAKMDGTFQGENGDERPVPNFYRTYAEGKNKPMAISETSALFNGLKGTAASSGDSNVAIKSAWMDQVFAPNIPQRYPRLRLINWFEQTKIEADVQGNPVTKVDWGITRDEAVLRAFKARMPSWLVMAPTS